MHQHTLIGERARSVRQALVELRAGAGTQFDPAVVGGVRGSRLVVPCRVAPPRLTGPAGRRADDGLLHPAPRYSSGEAGSRRNAPIAAAAAIVSLGYAASARPSSRASNASRMRSVSTATASGSSSPGRLTLTASSVPTQP